MTTTWWENGSGTIVAYLCYKTDLPVLETRRSTAKKENQSNIHMFSDLETIANPDDVIETDRRISHIVRLPYTERMLQRWEERNART